MRTLLSALLLLSAGFASANTPPTTTQKVEAKPLFEDEGGAIDKIETPCEPGIECAKTAGTTTAEIAAGSIGPNVTKDGSCTPGTPGCPLASGARQSPVQIDEEEQERLRQAQRKPNKKGLQTLTRRDDEPDFEKVTKTAPIAGDGPVQLSVDRPGADGNPPSSQTQEDRSRVGDFESQGRREEARQFAIEALKRNPGDPELQGYVALTAPVKKAVDEKTMKARAALLEDGSREIEELKQQPLLASPLSFGAAAGAASRGPAFVGGIAGAGAGAAPADAAGAAAFKDAANKIGMKDFAGADSALTRRIEAGAKDGPTFRLRSLARRGLGRWKDSAEDARTALAADPKDKRALRLLADGLVDSGRPSEAVAEVDRFLLSEPLAAEAFVSRARAYAALGRADDELADLERAAALDEKFDEMYQDTLSRREGGARRGGRSWAVWAGAIGTALLFFSFALFRKRGDSSLRLALRKEDHEVLKAAAVPPEAVPKGFKVVKTLGRGGMGVVYEAVDIGLQRTVALKKLRPEIADNVRERGRFLKEARTVAGLKHPNIVEIHAIHEDAEGLFLVFEKVPGESLHDRLARGPLPAAEIALLLKQVAAALDYAHGQGVVHQDLKPANVMVGSGTAKVMDFGIARRVAETMSTLSKVEIAGTPAYMSPEQEQGVVTPSADVFALGACAYEALTGKTPYPSGGLMMKAQKLYRPPTEAAPTLRKDVDVAIARALEPRPEDRWPTASSFADALARALS